MTIRIYGDASKYIGTELLDTHGNKTGYIFDVRYENDKPIFIIKKYKKKPMKNK